MEIETQLKAQTPSTVGHIVFKRSSGKGGDIGDIDLVLIGDIVSYRDASNANAAGRVEKVNVKARKLRVEVQKYKDYVLRPGRTLDFSEILEVSRRWEAPLEPALDGVIHEHSDTE